MFEPPDHYRNMSLRLSQVLDDIGVSERVVTKRRRMWLLMETMSSIDTDLYGFNCTAFHVGSLIEGSTTIGLQSDLDVLECNNKISVIQDWSEWRFQPNKCSLLMVQDDSTSPGYCLLQPLSFDFAPSDFQCDLFATDSCGRVLVKHLICNRYLVGVGRTRNGPATRQRGVPNLTMDADLVPSFHCPFWPKEAEPWLHKQNVSGWPTEDMKRYAEERGCFVVPVASRESPNQDTEWRISTFLAERCLMLNLNMTQLRCYILMKMIVKTFFQPRCEDAITSFMCKNVLFHCMANSNTTEWNDCNLVIKLHDCLDLLCYFISAENCPHFIMPRNNLLAGKLSIPMKQKLVEIMCTIKENIEDSLLSISIDELGDRLCVKSGWRIFADRRSSSELIAGFVSADIISRIAKTLQTNLPFTMKFITEHDAVTSYNRLVHEVSKLCQIYSVGSRIEQIACFMYAPLHIANTASIMASVDLYTSQTISQTAMRWFSVGLNSDLSSCRLKLASALYCAGHIGQCEEILSGLSLLLEHTHVLSTCNCYTQAHGDTADFVTICIDKNELDVIRQNIAFCVIFLSPEINCVPKELRYEFYRRPEENRTYRGWWMNWFFRLDDESWMDWATVDALPYLYFLLYKVNTQLRRPDEQQRALNNLVTTINIEPNLGHRETALNLLGQCMEQENRTNAALSCYMMSLTLRGSNNVAIWHVCRMLAVCISKTCSITR